MALKMMSDILKVLPHYAKGEIVKGFGRGSRELGIPTANFPEEVVESLPQQLNTGIYCGFAQVDDGAVNKMVMSIGWNPFYNNEKKAMETHILHKFDGDLYGKLLKVVIVEFLRPEVSFESLDALIEAINKDISDATEKLSGDLAKFKEDDFFKH